MKSVVKPLSYIAMAISFTMSTLVLADTVESVKPTAAPAPAAQPVVHHKHKSMANDGKAADSAAAAVTDKTVVTEKTTVIEKTAATEKAAVIDKTAAGTQTAPTKVVAAIPAEKPATAVEPAKSK